MTVFDFGKGIPDCVHAIGGTLSVNTDMVKQGTGSLDWSFNKGDKLVFDTDIGYKKLAPDGKDFRSYVFGMYMFGFGAEGTLTVSFLKDEEEKVSLNIVLGFSGWRSATACFERDMKGTPTEGMNRMVITANADGRLLLSELVTANRVDARHVLKSYQVPDINNNEILFIKNWQLGAKYKNKPVDSGAVEKITERTLKYLKSELSSVKDMTFSELSKRADDFEITENEYGVTGTKVEWYNQRRIVDDTLWQDEKYISLRTITNLMYDIAAYFVRSKDECAEELYIKLLKYIIVQGFAEGSSFGTHKILDYGIRPFYASAFVMRKAIKKAGLLSETVAAMLWFLHACQRGFTDEIEMKLASSDDFFNSARGLLYAILLTEDEKKQTGMLYAFSDWVSESLKVRVGLTGMFKDDGSIFHHHGHYISYGNGGLSGITAICYALSGTAFDISDKAYSTLKKVLTAVHFQCNKSEVPIALSGRHPTGKEKIYPDNYKFFALCAIERGDFEAAGLYLSLKNEPSDELDEEIFLKAKRGVNDKGCESYPLACCMVHKRKNFLAVAKGYSKYLWGSEIYKADNLYGRYRSYGTLELINEENPFSHDGYDWNHFPGTTAINLPLEKLKANILNVDAKSGFEEMLLSTESFAGGVTLSGNGMFSMKLSAHPKYEGNLKAQKSVFFYDDFILCLGSGICANSEFETQTTLYQVSADKTNAKTLLNGKEFSGNVKISDTDVLTDGFNNNYYIKGGSDVLVLSGVQKSRHSETDEETEGVFDTAVIRHGKTPENADYEYAICVNGAEKKDYTILRQDNLCHAVKIGNITYMAIFEPGKVCGVSTNEPVLLLISENDTKVRIAVCNPDLALYDEDRSQFDENGKQKEVSIYSRKWTQNPIGTKHILLETDSGFKLDADLKGGSIYTFGMEK